MCLENCVEELTIDREKQNRTGSQVSAVILGQGMTAWLGLQVFLVASVVPAFNVVSLRLTWVVIMSFFLTPETMP